MTNSKTSIHEGRQNRIDLSEAVNMVFEINKKTAIVPLMQKDMSGKRRVFFYLYFNRLCSAEDLTLEYYLIHQLYSYIKSNRKEVEEGKQRYGAYNNEDYSNYCKNELGVTFGKWLAANAQKQSSQWQRYIAAPYIHPLYVKLEVPVFPRSVKDQIMQIKGEYVAVVLYGDRIALSNAQKSVISANINYMMSVYLEESFRQCTSVAIVDRLNKDLAPVFFKNPAILKALEKGKMVFFFYRKVGDMLVHTPYFFQSFDIECNENA